RVALAASRSARRSRSWSVRRSTARWSSSGRAVAVTAIASILAKRLSIMARVSLRSRFLACAYGPVRYGSGRSGGVVHDAEGGHEGARVGPGDERDLDQGCAATAVLVERKHDAY